MPNSALLCHMSKADQLRAMREANQSTKRRSSGGLPMKLSDPALNQVFGAEGGSSVPVSRLVEHKRGRPLAKDAHHSFEHTKPWETEGMSRRTWYRRKATTG